MSDVFTAKCAVFGPQLMRDLRLTAEQAAGLLGNLGHESGGWQHFQEIGKRHGQGGAGIAQWTGARRHFFEAWLAQHGLSATSDAGNYGYLLHELTGAYAYVVRALQQCATLEQATRSVCTNYEKPRIPAMSSRLAYARRALAVLHPGHPASVAPVRRAARTVVPAAPKKSRIRRDRHRP